ncbi:MAG TPA: DUF1573 domain-containing protein [Flavobacteriales bacterium]|nr:DUF1573 domain-containing protein [Flavobacteriales bacterium]
MRQRIDSRARRIVASVLAIIISLIVRNAATAQSMEQWIAWGDAAFASGEYYGATRFYNGALAIDGGRMSLQWKQAEACRLSNQYDKAAMWYEKVQRKDNGRTHHDALRWLAEMQMSQGLYAEASSTWHKVQQKEKDKTSFIAKRAENALLGCALAADSSKTNRLIELSHLPQPVNSYDSEFGARRGPDSLLYFSSLRGEVNDDGEVKDSANYHTALYSAGENGTSWSAPNAVTKAANANGDNANSTWSLDGKWIIFTRCEEGHPCRLHIAPVTANGIGEATVLSGINEELYSTQPMIARWADREMLLFVSDRPGGEGGMDIWQGEFHNGEVKFIYPLGKPVNTPGDERTPWFDNVTNTIWYSSDFLPGLGGYDIFSAAFGDDVFANPVNAGVPINGPANDLYPVYDPKRGEGWLTSNRKGSFAAKGETCCNDLYRFTFPQEQEKLIANVPLPPPEPIRTITNVERLASMRDRFPLKLYFHNDEPEPRSWSTTTPQTYGETYAKYTALERTYEENTDAIAIRGFFEKEVDYGYRELIALGKALFDVLEEGRSVTVETRGHASPLARNDYNRNLSMRRIESLRNHLRTMDDGRLAQYLDGGSKNGAKLTITELPFGEDRSAKGVSDELAHLDKSVYDVNAARERRIEVVAIQLLQNVRDSTYERQVMQLGTLKQNEERRVRFTLHNDGNKPMTVLRAEPDCGCTTAEIPKGKVPPGGSTGIELVFNGHAAEGALRRTVTVETDGYPAKIDLVIEGKVVQ